MILDSATTSKVQLITSAAADIEVSGSVVVVSTASPPVGDGTNTRPITLASITTAATTDVAAGIASTKSRVDELAISNNHASTSCDVTVQRTDGTNTDVVIKATLLAGESLVYTRSGTWLHYDTNAVIKPVTSPLTTKGDIWVYDTGQQRLGVGANDKALIASSGAATGLAYAGLLAHNFSTSTVSAGFATDTYLSGSRVAFPSGGPIAGARYRCRFDMVKTGAWISADQHLPDRPES